MTPPPDHTLDATRLDATASDPASLRWMVGAPPPSDRLIRFTDGSFARFPRTRWSYSHMRQLMPTSVVPRQDAPVVVLPRRERDDLDTVTFQTLGSRVRMSWAE